MGWGTVPVCPPPPPPKKKNSDTCTKRNRANFRQNSEQNSGKLGKLWANLGKFGQNESKFCLFSFCSSIIFAGIIGITCRISCTPICPILKYRTDSGAVKKMHNPPPARKARGYKRRGIQAKRTRNVCATPKIDESWYVIMNEEKMFWSSKVKW